MTSYKPPTTVGVLSLACTWNGSEVVAHASWSGYPGILITSVRFWIDLDVQRPGQRLHHSRFCEPARGLQRFWWGPGQDRFCLISTQPDPCGGPQLQVGRLARRSMVVVAQLRWPRGERCESSPWCSRLAFF